LKRERSVRSAITRSFAARSYARAWASRL
jgi:hypothetical protein